MSLFDMDDILDTKQLKAPADFTQSVMQRIEAYEIKTASKPVKSYPAGLSLIAASLIVLFINLTPFMDSLVKGFQSLNSYGADAIDFESVSDSIQYFTLKVDSLISKPFNILAETIIKEDSYDE